jgi:hypothetical protein
MSILVNKPKSSSSSKSRSKVTTVIHDHSPTLATIKMVEDTIRKTQYFRSKNHLFRSLTKQVQYQTLVKILTYLQESNKITFNKDGSIIWIFVNTPQAKKLLHESKPFKKF